MSYLFATIVHDAFGIFQHLLSPQLKEVIGIRVEFQTIFAIVSITIQFIQWRWFITSLHNGKKQNSNYYYLFQIAKQNRLTLYVSNIGAGIVARENIC